jgi:hypothetical protein
MNNCAFDPAMLFISVADWADEAQRDDFLRHLLDHLSFIDRFGLTRILWTDELESCIWSEPQLPPWRMDRDWNLQLVPVIRRMFHQNLELVTGTDGLTPCNLAPELSSRYGRVDIDSSFRRLMHRLLFEGIEVYLCLSRENHGSEGIECVCDCHEATLRLTTVATLAAWYGHVDIEAELWPASAFDSTRLGLAVEMVCRVRFARTPEAFRYSADWSTDFVRAVSREVRQRREIVDAIAKRLLLTQAQAARDAGLHDEPVRGQRGLRRFRVSRRRRIHYRYARQGLLRFEDYYDDGRHDRGL